MRKSCKRTADANDLQFTNHTTRPFSGRMFWAHHIRQGLPNFSDFNAAYGPNGYGDSYPLDLVKGTYTDWTTKKRATDGIPRMMQAGITGINSLTFSNETTFESLNRFLPEADATHANADPTQHFYLAPCLEGGNFTSAAIQQYFQNYVSGAASHPSLAQVQGKYAVFLYGARSIDGLNSGGDITRLDATKIQQSVTAWTNIRQWLTTNDVPVFLVRDISANFAYWQNVFKPEGVTPWNHLFDAHYMFESAPRNVWKELVPYINQQKLTWVGGLMPGYDRETLNGGYRDARGTKALREMLAWYRRAGAIQWQHIITWGDFVEDTQVQASSNWHKTRADIVAFYSALHRGIPAPRSNPTLYITTPMFVTEGEPFNAEGMVINPTNQRVRVSIQLYQADRTTTRGSSQVVTVYGGTTGDATTSPSLTATSADVGRYVYAQATLLDENNNVLETVWSAPIVVYAPLGIPADTTKRAWQDNNWPFSDARITWSPHTIRHRYYSIPAYAKTTTRPTLVFDKSPASLTATTPNVDKATATITAPIGTNVRFIELIQNTRQVANGFDVASFAVKAPMADRTIIGGLVTSANPKGFYLARVITEDEKVMYSDPIYFN